MSPDALPADRIVPPPRWVYEQTTGKLWLGSECVGVGYSGHAEGKNQPDLESVKGVGPLPRGQWRMGPAIHHQLLGPVAIPLAPELGTKTYGRSGFWVHGDSRAAPGTASHGCLIFARAIRERLADSQSRTVEVVARLPLEVA